MWPCTLVNLLHLSLCVKIGGRACVWSAHTCWKSWEQWFIPQAGPKSVYCANTKRWWGGSPLCHTPHRARWCPDAQECYQKEVHFFPLLNPWWTHLVLLYSLCDLVGLFFGLIWVMSSLTLQPPGAEDETNKSGTKQKRTGVTCLRDNNNVRT